MFALVTSAACLLAPTAPFTDEAPHLIRALEYAHRDDTLKAYIELYHAHRILDDKYDCVPFEKLIQPVLVFMYTSWLSGDDGAFLSAIDTLENLMIFEFDKK